MEKQEQEFIYKKETRSKHRSPGNSVKTSFPGLLYASIF